MAFIDITGERYNKLTVLSLFDKRGNFRRWLCRCDCGTECIKYGHQIRASQVVSCGCVQRQKASETGKRKARNLIGRRFKRLVVLERRGTVKRHAAWLCECDCGEKKVVLGNSLLTGNTTSCGCFHREMIADMFTDHDMTDKERFESRHRETVCPELRFWRKRIYARDNWTCQICKRKNGIRIVAHHLDAWKSYPDKRLNDDNGVTSCVDCHIEFHSTYGKGKNTRDQWGEFVASKAAKEEAA